MNEELGNTEGVVLYRCKYTCLVSVRIGICEVTQRLVGSSGDLVLLLGCAAAQQTWLAEGAPRQARHASLRTAVI